jgi:hypothetical protein
MLDEFWAHRILSTDRVPSPPRVSEVRSPLQRWSLSQESVLLGSVSRDGVRAVDLPRESPRHRSVPSVGRRQFRGKVARSTLVDAKESRDWRMYADFAQVLIAIARPLYVHDPIGVDLDQSLYALDSTTIDLCLSLFPWAKFRKHKAAVKMHTLLDLHGNIPTFIRITDGKVHDVNILDEIMPEAGAFYVMDRGYIDFERLFVFTLCSAFFVVRSKENVLLQRRYSHPVDKTTGVRSDHTVILTWLKPPRAQPWCSSGVDGG